MTVTLTVEAPHATGDARKTRAFSATLLAALVAPGVGTGAVHAGTVSGDANVYRPLWVAFAGQPTTLNPFIANLRMGRTAAFRTYKTLEYGVETIRSAEYEWHTHTLPGGLEVRSAFLRGPFALDPGFVDPERVAFVCAPTASWLTDQPPPPVSLSDALAACAPWLAPPDPPTLPGCADRTGAYLPSAIAGVLHSARPTPDSYQAWKHRADRDGEPEWWGDDHPTVVAWQGRVTEAATAQWRCLQRVFGVRDIDRIRRIAPLATAYLDRRIAAPILADPVFHVRLWCRILAESRTRCPDLVRRFEDYAVGDHAGGWSALLIPTSQWSPVEGQAPPIAGDAADHTVAATEAPRAVPTGYAPGVTPAPDPLGAWIDRERVADDEAARVESAEYLARFKAAGKPVPKPAEPRRGRGGDDALEAWDGCAWTEWKNSNPKRALVWSRYLGDTFAEVLAVSLDPAWVRAILAAETRAYLQGTPIERVEFKGGVDPARDATADAADPPAGEDTAEDGDDGGYEPDDAG